MRAFALYIAVFATLTGTCLQTEELDANTLAGSVEQVNDLILDQATVENHQAAARAFGAENTLSRELARSSETFHVTYETLNNGVFCHVAWYVDGYVITALNGATAGKQMVVINGNVISISYVMDTMVDCFVHYHTWCTIYSFPSRQLLVNF